MQILTYTPSARLALTRQTGTGRVAWRAGDGLPVVQCVRVRRDGPLTGGGVELLSVSAPIRGDGVVRTVSQASNRRGAATCRRAGCWDSP